MRDSANNLRDEGVTTRTMYYSSLQTCCKYYGTKTWSFLGNTQKSHPNNKRLFQMILSFLAAYRNKSTGGDSLQPCCVLKKNRQICSRGSTALKQTLAYYVTHAIFLVSSSYQLSSLCSLNGLFKRNIDIKIPEDYKLLWMACIRYLSVEQIEIEWTLLLATVLHDLPVSRY